ncbi:vWA domain-containing protein [Clostridium amazonitimonense]|uniref:vWA domain-containing protein n=1 Tax=Clostridium amazonitimonense TaxID=1499689 RepID=UPI0009E01A4B|nr:VWA-like domain-containing protein [Clostridium amazonitimonense]
MGSRSVEALRVDLLKRLTKFYTGNKEEDKIIMGKNFGDEFKRDFNELLERCILSLMEGEDNFFGLFMIQTKREISFDIEWPISTEIDISSFKMYFNPWKFLNCSFEEMKSLIKHEIYHIMYGHHVRAKDLYNKYGRTPVNLAMDISVNQFIKGLPSWAAKLDNIALEFNVELRENSTMETYAKEIYEAIQKIMREAPDKKINLKELEDFDLESLHNSWENPAQSVNKEDMKELVKNTARNAHKGKSPRGLEEILAALNKVPEISWVDYLKKIIKSMPSGHRKTITRKDRRQPNRLELRGTLRDHISEILVAIDISGSITDKEIEQIFTEIFGIVKNKEVRVTVIECDDKVRRVYKLNSKKDLKPRLDKKGGTAFSPVFEYINKKSLRNSLLIYFTDGLGEEELRVKPINYKTLWILTGKGERLSLKKSYGEIKRLKAKGQYEADNTYGLKVMREMLHDWAR